MVTRREVLKPAALTGLASACGGGAPDPGAVTTTTVDPTSPSRVAVPEPRVLREDPRAIPEVSAFPLGVSCGDPQGSRLVVQCE